MAGSSNRFRSLDRLESSDAFDCQSCGACCLSPYTGNAYVALADDEATRLTSLQLPVILQRQGGDPPEVVPKLGTKLSANAMNICVALEGSAGSRCRCSVYEARPLACRQFEVGSKVCREARRRIGLPC
jgi:Fe-S-cluster containining protein